MNTNGDTVYVAVAYLGTHRGYSSLSLWSIENGCSPNKKYLVSQSKFSEINSINSTCNTVYAGTDNGLWFQETGKHWTPSVGSNRKPHTYIKTICISDFALTQQNLAVLYRLSMLPRLTGMSINEALVAAGLEDITKSLISTKGAMAKTALEKLIDFSKWIKNAPFSLYQLQFITTGTSDDPAIGNSIIGEDAIKNFSNELDIAVDRTLLTKHDLFNDIKSKLQQEFTIFVNAQKTTNKFKKGDREQVLSKAINYIREISDEIDKNLKKNNYISADSIIEKKAKATDCEALIISSIVTVINNKHCPLKVLDLTKNSESCKTFAENLKDNVCSTINRTYDLQQTTFLHHLAALYHTTPQLAIVLKEWGCLRLEPQTFSEENLQRLQQAAELFTVLKLSHTEVEHFKDDYQPERTKPAFSLNSIKTICRLKEIVQKYQDTQNQFLSILDDKGKSLPVEKLAKLTGWDSGQIKYLDSKLLPSDDKQYTTNNIALMQRYFDIAGQLEIDVGK